MSDVNNIFRYESPLKRVFLHFLFWCILFSMYLVSYKRFDVNYSWLLAVKELFAIISIFYFTSYFIIPKYLLKGRYILFFICFLAMYFWWGLLTYLTCLGINSYITVEKRLQEYVNHVLNMGIIGLFKYSTFTFYLLDFIYFISLPLGIKLTKAILNIRSEKTELELSNLQLELAFLKAQVNPHFLFNTINNIIFLVSEDPERAEKSLSQLSGIMNYLVYESDQKKASLNAEFIFLDSYIELEKLRLSNKVVTTIDICTDDDDYTIVPLIIFPFVENAFKHGPMSSSKNAWVNIKVTAANGKLEVYISNSYKIINKPSGYIGGIGLENVRKRLDLNYPDQYFLEINKELNVYTVKLDLNLNAPIFSESKFVTNYE